MPDSISQLPPSVDTLKVDFSWSPRTTFSYVVDGDTFPDYSGGGPDVAWATLVGTAITFVADVTFRPDRPAIVPVTYHWDFDDGQTGEGPSVVHTFTVVNLQQRVHLQVMDSLGRTVGVGYQINLHA